MSEVISMKDVCLKLLAAESEDAVHAIVQSTSLLMQEPVGVDSHAPASRRWDAGRRILCITGRVDSFIR